MENNTKGPKQLGKKALVNVIVLIVVLFALGFAGLVIKSGNPFFANIREKISSFFSSQDFALLGAADGVNKMKIPLDAQHIDFAFSTNIDKASLTKDTFKIAPKIDGEVSVVDGNILRYTLREKPKAGEVYTIQLSKDISSDDRKTLVMGYTYEIEVISAVKVTRIVPEGNLENLSQNIAVFFNVPMVPLTNLDNRDKLPCPLEISPKVAGTCKWTTTSVLEFVPTTHFEGATEYTVNVVNMTGLNYPISGENKIIIKTPKLDLYISERFVPKNGLTLVFNYPVDIKNLQEKLVLKQNLQAKKFTITQLSGSESMFVVKLVGEDFIYNTNYDVHLVAGLKPKYGNVEMAMFDKTIATYDFLDNVTVYQNIYSSTGALINTREHYYNAEDMYSNNRFLPKDNMFFQLFFQEEVSLDKSNYAFVSKDGKKIDYTISYMKEEKISDDQSTREIVENKNTIKIVLKSPLENSSTYKLVIYKKTNPNLKEDVVTEYKTSPKLVIKSLKFLSYNKSCLYLSNPMDFYDENGNYNEQNVFNHITTTPKSRIASVYYRNTYGGGQWNEECPEPKEGEFLHVIDTRLNPYTDYKLSITRGVKDVYGNVLQESTTKDVKTQGIEEQDKYLYSSHNYKSLIPSNLPIVINLQTINLDKVNFEACEMNLEGYFQYLATQERGSNGYAYGYDYGYVPMIGQTGQGLPFCRNDKIMTLKVKDKYRTISNNKFDLESDILGSKFSENFVYTRGSVYGFADFQKQDYSKKFENVYIRSNIAMALEKGVNKNLLFITSIDGKKTLGDLALSFYKNDYTPLKLKYSFNTKKGVYEFNNSEEIRFIVAQKGSTFGMLDTNSDALSNYDFKYIAGEPTSQKNYLYLYTDRPLYKPGDTVYFKGLLRKFNFDGYKKSDIKAGKLEIVDENNKTIKELSIKLDPNSNFDGKFDLPKDIGLGRFNFKLSVDQQYLETYSYDSYIQTNAYFYIEEYVKPTFKVDATSERKDYALGENTTIKLEPKYYFGGKMVNTVGTYSIISQSYFFDAKDYSDYQFGEGYQYFDCLYRDSCNYADQYYDSQSFAIDESGQYSFKYLFPEKDAQGNLLGEKIFSFNFDVVDPDTKRTVNKTVSQVLHNTDGYVGIQIPYWNAKGKGINFAGIVLDWNANPKQADVTIQVIKQERQSVKKEGLNGVFYNEYTMKETKEDQFTLTANAKGEISKTIKTKGAGEYLIKASYKGANGKEFVSSQNIYIGGDYEDYLRNIGNNSVTELVADKNMLNVGETQNLMLKSPVDNGKALVVIEKDDGILDYFVHDIKSFSDNIAIPVKETYYPNFYVKVFLIGSQDKNPLPVYKRALSVTKVNTEYKNLNINIASDKTNYLPGDKVKLTIKVLDAKGKPVANANGSIAVVDQSLLALKGNPIKNPYAFFYDMKRYLGIITYSPMINLIEKLEIKDGSDGSKGGDGPQLKGGNSKKKRGIFKDTAFRYANFKTDAAGTYILTTDALPDNLTTRVVETLVTSDDTKIGVNTMTFETNKKVMISDNLPQVLGSRDEITLSPVIFNKIGTSADFDVTLTASHATVATAIQRVSIKNGEQKTVTFKVNVEDIGINEDKNTLMSQITIKVKSLASDDEDTIQKFVQIKETSTPEYIATVGKTDKVSFDEKIQIGDVINNAGLLKINYGASLFASVLDGITYLQNYPYGCLEQRTSTIMPSIYVKKLYTSVDKPYDLTKKMVKYRESAEEGYKEKSVDETIKDYLVEAKKFQNSDGGFVYRYDTTYTPNYSDFGLTTYIVQSLSAIKSIGYTVDAASSKNAVAYLKNRFYKNTIEGCVISQYNTCRYQEQQRLDAIYAVLAYNPNDYEAYKMWNQLKFENEDRSIKIQKAKVITALVKLAGITAKEKENLTKQAIDTINEMLNEDLVFTPKEAYIGRSESRSRIETTAKFLEIITLLGQENFKDIQQITDNMNRWILGQKKNESFGSTAENMSVIKAITTYLEKSGELKYVNMAVKLKINSELLESKAINDENKLAVFNKTLKLDTLKADNIFTVEKSGKGSVYYDLNLSYYLPSADIQARDEGFAVERVYYSYDAYKKIQSFKEKELQDYYDYKITYEQLKYPKSIVSYLTPIKSAKVGDLVIVYNKIITSEARDQVSFEGFVPAGSELINPNLDTSTKVNVNDTQNVNDAYGYGYGYESERPVPVIVRASNNDISLFGSNIFQKTEFRADRFFAFAYTMSPGIYEFTYIIRMTHAGTFNIKPTMIAEFYNPEVFGRTNGEGFVVE